MTRAEASVRSKVVRRLQTPKGHYAMLALDQRESLRAMFPRDAGGSPVSDRTLRAFKQAGIDVLTPHASAVLLDRPYAVTATRPLGIAENCGLIVAADVLHQTTGRAITDVSFDELVTIELLHKVEADAIKLLVLWHPTTGRDQRARLVTRALDLAVNAGVASLIEGIAKPDHGQSWTSDSERHDAILSCAEELTSFEPDIYKAEVPGYVSGDVSQVAEQSAQMSAIVGGDWVVLSSGVDKDMFAAAVAEARIGGATGFLAGRAIWADTVLEADLRHALSTRSVDRLERLAAIIDSEH